MLGSLGAREALRHILDVARGSPLVIGLRSMGKVDQVLRHVWPELRPLAQLPHPLQHLVRVHVPVHCHPALLPDDLHCLDT